MRGLIVSGVPELLLVCLAFMMGDGDRYASILAAALVHELGHVLAAVILGVKMRFCRTGMAGVTLSYDFSVVSHGREVLVCLAGPAAGVAVFFLGYRSGASSYFAGASLGLTMFNLLPISFLDGGGVLSALLSMFLPADTVWIVCRTVSVIFTLVLWGGAVFLLVSIGGDISLIAAAVYLLYRLFSEC